MNVRPDKMPQARARPDGRPTGATGRGGPGGGHVAIEGFAVETRDGLIFTVKGLVHPPGGTVAYLRYVPDAAGDRRHRGQRYRRVSGLAAQLAELRARGLDYVADDPTLGLSVQVVPEAQVRVVHDPRERLAQLAARGATDALEEAAVVLCRLVATAAGVSLDAVGVTGSLLFGLQNAGSDLDIVVYGADECRAVHGALHRLMREEGAPLSPPAAAELAAIAARHREDTPISDADFLRLQARKVNEGRFGAHGFFVRFVKLPQETRERYGDPVYEPLGPMTVRGWVHDASEALFTPCRYGVAEVTCEHGPGAAVNEIVSFRGRFADQAERGDHVHARGTVERVVWRSGAAGVRLVVGAPGD